MAFHPANPWLMDVLEKGKHSQFASFFDIIRDNKLYDGRVMVPFLGSTPEETIEKGEIKIIVDEEGIYLAYYDNKYPVQPNSYYFLLHQKKRLTADVKQVIKNISELETLQDPIAFSEKWHEIKTQSLQNEVTKKALHSSIEAANNNKELLLEITNQQQYQLCHWQETDYQINYRRFFTINGLICLNIQHEHVFNHYHRLIGELTNEGIFNGLRVDHIDGFVRSQYLLITVTKPGW
jgi:maltooligosyltrehalose synthase